MVCAQCDEWFQYPLRVEVGCNMEIDGVLWTDVRFQYPLRVEVGCNALRFWSTLTSFIVSVPSTGRSGLQPRTRLSAPNSHTRFSTLYGSKWVATHRLHTVRALFGHVSVPSTGRSGLQLTHLDFYARLRACFSTLYGSKWVAPHSWRVPPASAGVSVPSTGRSGLQHGK